MRGAVCVLVAKERAASLIEVLNDWYSLEAGAGGAVGAAWYRGVANAGVAVFADVIRLAGKVGFGSFAGVVTVAWVTRVSADGVVVDGNAVSDPPPIPRSRGVRAPPIDPRGVGFPSFTPGEGGVLSATQEVGFPSK